MCIRDRDMAHLGPGGLLCNQVVVRGEVSLEGSFVVLDAVVHQGTGALALAVQDVYKRQV